MKVSPQPVYSHIQHQMEVSSQPVHTHTQHTITKWKFLPAGLFSHPAHSTKSRCLPSLYIQTPTQHRAPNGGVSPACLFTHLAHSTKWWCLHNLFIHTPSAQYQMEVSPQPVYIHTWHTAPTGGAPHHVYSHTWNTASNGGVSLTCLFSHPAHSIKWRCLPSLFIPTPSTQHHMKVSPKCMTLCNE